MRLVWGFSALVQVPSPVHTSSQKVPYNPLYFRTCMQMEDFSQVDEELANLTRNHLACLASICLQLVDVLFSWCLHSFLKNSDFLPCRWDKNIIGVGESAESAALDGCHKTSERFAIFGSKAWRQSCITYLRPSLMSPFWNKWMALVCEKLALCRFV